MNSKHIKLPKDGLVGPDEAKRTGLIDQGDVEGHGLPTTAPPSLGSSRMPGHGGENIPTPIDDDDDVEGHRRTIA